MPPKTFKELLSVARVIWKHIPNKLVRRIALDAYWHDGVDWTSYI